MALYTVAYYKANVGNTPEDIDALPDQVFPVFEGLFMSTVDISLVAAAAVAPVLEAASILTPSLQAFGAAGIRPLNADVIAGTQPLFPADPSLMLLDPPLQIPRGEPISVNVTLDLPPAMTKPVLVLLWLADSLGPPPNVGTRWVKFTSTTSAVANTWTKATLETEDSVPSGRYAVFGMEHYSTNAMSARLIFETSRSRPGVISMTNPAHRTHPAFYDGRFGLLGEFQSPTYPYVEVLCDGTDNDHTVYLRLARIG